MNKDRVDATEQSLTPPLNAAIILALFNTEVREKQLARKVIWLQALITFVVAAIVYVLGSLPQYSLAVLVGGGVSVLNSALIAWRMSRVTSHPAHDAHQQLRLLYFYAAERFLVVIALLGIVMAVLKFSPLAVLGGFVLGQAALLGGRLFLKSKD